MIPSWRNKQPDLSHRRWRCFCSRSFDGLAENLTVFRVNAGFWFVQKHQIRMLDEQLENSELLRLTAGMANIESAVERFRVSLKCSTVFSLQDRMHSRQKD